MKKPVGCTNKSVITTDKKALSDQCSRHCSKGDNDCSDTKELIPLLESINIPQGTAILADKGSVSRENCSYLQTHHLQDSIMHKVQRDRVLTEQEKLRNEAISPIRSLIERSFGSIRRWFHGGRCRFWGLHTFIGQYPILRYLQINTIWAK